MTLPWRNDYNDFIIWVKEDADRVILSVYDRKSVDETKLLLRFSLEKFNFVSSKAEFLEVGRNLKAVLYRPVMGGDHLIVALGRRTTDLSPDEILKSLPDWNTPYFKCPLCTLHVIECDENGVTTKEDYVH